MKPIGIRNQCSCIRRIVLLSLAAVGVLLVTGQRSAVADEVALLLTPNEPYEHAAKLISEALSRDGHKCSIIRFSQHVADSEPAGGLDHKGESLDPDQVARQLAETRPRVAVALGTAGTTLALQTLDKTPVVFCMVPNVLDRQFTASSSRDKQRLAGVTTDIGPRDQLTWLKRLSPSVKKLGVLASERSKATAESLAAEGRKQDVAVQVIPAKRDDFPAAIAALEAEGCDGVLMIADAEVYNSASVQRLLLWGLRNRKPVWAFSPNLVKAGALAAVYAEPESIAQQTAGLIKKLLAGESPAKLGMQYPERVLSAANLRTAEMIGLSLSKEVQASLTAQFGQQ